MAVLETAVREKEQAMDNMRQYYGQAIQQLEEQADTRAEEQTSEHRSQNGILKASLERVKR